MLASPPPRIMYYLVAFSGLRTITLLNPCQLLLKFCFSEPKLPFKIKEMLICILHVATLKQIVYLSFAK